MTYDYRTMPWTGNQLAAFIHFGLDIWPGDVILSLFGTFHYLGTDEWVGILDDGTVVRERPEDETHTHNRIR